MELVKFFLVLCCRYYYFLYLHINLNTHKMITLTPVNPKWEATPDLIGKYINEHLWSDVNPVGVIVAVIGKTKLVCNRVVATENKTKMEFVVGGFSAHCTNQYQQEWEFENHDDDVFVVNYSRTNFKRMFYGISDKPRKFYDYNF